MWLCLLRFFFSGWFKKNYTDLKALNPQLDLLLRTSDNAMPAVTTELTFTLQDQLRFMIQDGRFKDENETISEARVEAAKAYLNTDWQTIRNERWASPGFDPCRPYLEESHPNWRDDPKIASDLKTYLALKDAADEQLAVIKSGPNDEFKRAQNALLMCQRVDLWCAGEAEVEAAVKHLAKLGKRFNSLEPDLPEYISEYYPGSDDLRD